MKSLPLVLALGCMLAPSGAGADTGLSQLTRRDEILGWEAVGRVDIGDHAFCTGTLIATDLVLTAAHCLFDKATGKPENVGQITFRAGLSGDEAIAESPVIRAVANPEYIPGQDKMTAENIRHDLALLQLAQPIPSAVAAPFTVADPAGVKEVSVVSYARGREDALSWQKVCTVIGQQGGLIGFNCDVDFGSSGAPVFDRSGNRARIVSIVSAGNRTDQGVTAFGMDLPAGVADLKAALRSDRGVLTAEAPQAEASATAASTGTMPTIRRIGVGTDSGNIGARFVKP